MQFRKLFSLSVSVLLPLVIAACSNDVPSVSPNQAADMLNNKEAIILDVRERDERDEEHIEGTLFIPLAQLESRMGELGKYKNNPIIVQCRSGRRSNIAGASLIKAGFKKILNLDGGILEWRKQGLETVRGPTTE
ncbi:MAG TPA: rhodanese-like domain-containing protein [Methylophilaceae bacterium]|nr:rhodanese-like domain-containing protein [Methylophilaceae bacterium]